MTEYGREHLRVLLHGSVIQRRIRTYGPANDA